ncbi:MAG TPA: hypothetical protein VJ826_12465 [Candidatus Polarisedimenticolaceae bacterium]|nr:hypothetical protein [Candidatus Polarisedimenticolaceae bacterium]
MKNALVVLPIVATLAVPALAIDVPQSRAEFVKAIEDGRGADVETIQIAQPLDKIYPVLEERAKTCLDVTVNRVANVGYVEQSSTDYNPTVRRVADDRAEFTLQLAHNPRAVGSTPPAGGLYFMAVDLRATEGGHTEVVLYRPSLGTKKITESLKAWLAGDPAPCPKLR